MRQRALKLTDRLPNFSRETKGASLFCRWLALPTLAPNTTRLLCGTHPDKLRKHRSGLPDRRDSHDKRSIKQKVGLVERRRISVGSVSRAQQYLFCNIRIHSRWSCCLRLYGRFAVPITQRSMPPSIMWIRALKYMGILSFWDYVVDRHNLTAGTSSQPRYSCDDVARNIYLIKSMALNWIVLAILACIFLPTLFDELMTQLRPKGFTNSRLIGVLPGVANALAILFSRAWEFLGR